MKNLRRSLLPINQVLVVQIGAKVSLASFLLAFTSTSTLANCFQTGSGAGSTYTCDTNSPNPYTTGKIGAPEGANATASGVNNGNYNNNTVTINAGSEINPGNSSAISLYDNAIINVYGTVKNASTNATGSYGTGGNTIEFRNNGTLFVYVNALVQATGTQTSGEAVNVQGTGNTITNYGVIESTRNNVAAIWSQNAGTLTIDNYGTIASGNRNAGNTNTVIGGNTGAGINFTNQNGASVYGSLLLGSGNDTVTLYTGSNVTGSINAGGGNDSLYLKGTGTQSLPANVTNFSNLYKQETSTWTLSSPLTSVLSGIAPRALQVQAGTLILTGDNSSYTGTTAVSSGATLQGSTSAIPNAVTNNGLVSFNEPSTGTYSGVISGSGNVEKIGVGTTTFTNANTYTGTTSVNAGTLNIASGATLASSSTSVASGATLNNSGSLLGGVVNSGTTTNSNTIAGAVTNSASGTIDNYGVINNTVANDGILNLNGKPTVTGAISGTGIVNVNGTFTQQATIGAGQLNVNSGSTLNMTNTISAATNIFSNATLNVINSQTLNGSLTNSGTISPLNSATNLTVNGVYSQGSGANFITRIDGLSSGSYSQIISNQPINIASGAVITAALSNRLILNPGDVVPAVIKGNGTPTNSGSITVNTLSDRYKLLPRYAGTSGENVDLYLPGSSITNAYNSPGTYYGALQDQTLATVANVQVPTLGVLHQRYALLNAVVEYDCNKFDRYNFCISAQARATGFGTQATGAGVLNIAYRPIPQVHIGAFIDYQAAAGNPATNASPIAVTLNNGGVQYGYDNPTFGGYAGFSQSGYSGNLINNGLQVMVSGAYNPGKVSVTRALIMNPYLPFVDAQPGSGNASLNSSVIRGMVGYGIALTDRATLMPYGGIRFTDVTRGAYMENFTAIVTQPLMYNSFYERLLTGFGGAMLNGKITDRFGTILGLGVETDLTRYANSFSGYSPIAIEYMTNFAFDHGGSWNGLRPTANAGAYYDVAPNQRISLNGFAGQQAWTSRTYATGLLGYQIAF